QLVRWCRELGIRAVGVGSAWNPANEANFQRFEGPDRDLYYSGRFDQKSVMDVAGVNATLRQLNAQSHGATSSTWTMKLRRTAWGTCGGLDISMITRHGTITRRTVQSSFTRRILRSRSTS